MPGERSQSGRRPRPSEAHDKRPATQAGQAESFSEELGPAARPVRARVPIDQAARALTLADRRLL